MSNLSDHEVALRRVRRWKSIDIHLSSREFVLAVGMAHLSRKTVPKLIVDLLVAELMDFDTKHPGLLEAEARKVLTAAGRSGRVPTSTMKEVDE